MTAPTEDSAVHYQVELSQDNGEGWRLYDTTPSLEWARTMAEVVSSRGSKVRIRRVVSARTVEIVEIVGAEGGG